MSRHFWVNGQGWVEEDVWRAQRAKEDAKRSDFPTPTVKGDIEPYQSPVDGRWITSRNQRRDDLRAHGCVEWEPGINQSAKTKRTPGKHISRKARLQGLPMREDTK